MAKILKRVTSADRKHLVLAAKRGAKFLDDNDASWWNDVPIGKLDMGSHASCLLGHHVGGYGAGLSCYALDDADAYRLGFSIPQDTLDKYTYDNELWSILAEAWAAELFKRQLADLKDLNLSGGDGV